MTGPQTPRPRPPTPRFAAALLAEPLRAAQRRIAAWSIAAIASLLALWHWAHWDLLSVPFVALLGALVGLGAALRDYHVMRHPRTPAQIVALAEREQAIRVAWMPYTTWIKSRSRTGTNALIGGITAVAIAQLLGRGHAIPAAALVASQVRRGEIWRLLTGPLLHGGPVHFWMNMGALATIGGLLEAFTSKRRLALVFLVALLGGSLLSVALSRDRPSVGVSGGILGLVGYLIVVAHYRPTELPPGLRSGLLKTVWLTAALGVVGFFFIDNAAHGGGLLGGAALGWLFRGEPVGPAASTRVATSRSASEVAGIAAWLILAFGGALAIWEIIAARG